jgi:hypothetical protein
MDSNIKACIINAALGSWYPKGQERLVRSLVYHGFQWDILTWTDWPNDNYDKSNPYNVKAAAFEEALKKGYTHILWLDCSVWALQHPEKMFDRINEQGYYINTSGHNCAQICADACLEYFGISRDEAETMESCSSGIMGINTLHPLGGQFLQRFIQAAKDGAFAGSRLHDNQSADPRFLFHRQDQSVASILFYQLGWNKFDQWELIHYYQPVMPASVIFAVRGM